MITLEVTATSFAILKAKRTQGKHQYTSPLFMTFYPNNSNLFTILIQTQILHPLIFQQ